MPIRAEPARRPSPGVAVTVLSSASRGSRARHHHRCGHWRLLSPSPLLLGVVSQRDLEEFVAVPDVVQLGADVDVDRASGAVRTPIWS